MVHHRVQDSQVLSFELLLFQLEFQLLGCDVVDYDELTLLLFELQLYFLD